MSPKTEAPQEEKNLFGKSFLCQKHWIFLGLAMVVVGSWPGWVPFFFPQETKVYLSSFLEGPKPVAPAPDAQLIQRLDALQQRVNAQEKVAASAPTDVTTLTRVVVEGAGWASLRQQLAFGQPYAQELEILKPLATPEQTQDLEVLAPYAQLGVPTPSALRDQLEKFVQDHKAVATKKASPPQESTFENLWRRAVEAFKSLVRISPDVSVAPSDMPLAQSLELLKQDKLQNAVHLWRTYLDKNKNQTLPPQLEAWYTHAKARLVLQSVWPRVQTYCVDMGALQALAQTLLPQVGS